MRTLRVVLVDDHPVVHEGVHGLLRDTDEIEIVGAAATAAEGIEVAKQLQPDIVLLDVRLPDLPFEQSLERIRAVSPLTKVVAFTAHANERVVEEVRRLGVAGFVTKDVGPERFVDILAATTSNGLESFPWDDVLADPADLMPMSLTPRQYEILRHVAIGQTNEEIARSTYLAPNTVKSYLQDALAKLGARNRVEAVTMLIDRGFL